MFRLRRFNRLGVALATAALLLSTLGVAISTAADSKDVDFTFGTFSSATDGGRTAVTVTLENGGGQTLNHVAFAGGDTANLLPYNPLFPRPGDSSLPDGASYAAIFPPTGFPSTGCSLTGGTANAYTSLFCDVGRLLPLTQLTYTLVINVPPASATPYATWLTVSWNEGWSTSGANADYTFATGEFSVGTASCTTATSSYFLPGELVDLNNGGGRCQDETASIASGAGLAGNGGHASLLIDGDFAVACPPSFRDKCYGATVQVEVLGGLPVPGGVQWTVTWHGVNSLRGVIHFGDDYLSDPTEYTDIPFSKGFKCSTTLTTNCWTELVSVGGPVTTRSFTATFVTPDNGRTGGYF